MWDDWQKAARAEVERQFASTQGGNGSLRTFWRHLLSLSFYGQHHVVRSVRSGRIDDSVCSSITRTETVDYAQVVDFGANIGLHSLILSRCGYQVRSFEPDPIHAVLLTKNLQLNNVTTELHQAAISLKNGTTEFVRVLGNTTGSHIAGAKANPYGELERFQVKLEAAAPHLAWADLAKIDIEGHEGELITGLRSSNLEKNRCHHGSGNAGKCPQNF